MTPEGRPDPAARHSPDYEVGVDGLLLDNLATSCTRYRQAQAGPFDPVKTLALTTEVLESVSTILATGQYALRQVAAGKAASLQERP